jgi:hypothetical protein
LTCREMIGGGPKSPVAGAWRRIERLGQRDIG